MFPPPQHFRQVRALLWVCPGLALMTGSLYAIFVIRFAEVPSAAAWAGVGLLVLVATVWGMATAWLSVYGTWQTLSTALFLYLLLALPLGVALGPAVWLSKHPPHTLPLALLVLVLIHSAVLAGATAWRVRRNGPLPMLDPGVSASRRWAGLRLRADRGTWEPAPLEAEEAAGRQGPWGGQTSAATGGLLSVGVFGLLKAWLAADTLYALIFVLGSAICVWLTTGMLSRGLARAVVLWRWEQRSDVRLAHPQALAFAAERERSVVGRWIRHRLPGTAHGRKRR